METEFQITHDEKELIIECLEADIKEKAPREDEDPMYKAYAECRIENIQSLIFGLWGIFTRLLSPTKGKQDCKF
tara:strand:+ start:11 stop:232 length:222 start_codon:yes stop_codon:yes gene_type:complete